MSNSTSSLSKHDYSKLKCDFYIGEKLSWTFKRIVSVTSKGKGGFSTKSNHLQYLQDGWLKWRVWTSDPIGTLNWGKYEMRLIRVGDFREDVITRLVLQNNQGKGLEN
jgi:hypothetical protein